MSKNFEIEERVAAAFLKSKGATQFNLAKFENDPPDILTHIGGRIIGIEVRALISNVPQVKLEKAFQKIFNRVREQLIKAGITNLVIRVEAEKNVIIDRDKCVEVITNVCLVKLDQIGLHRTELAKNPIPGIKKITAYRHAEDRIIISYDSRKHIFGPLRDKIVGSVIEEKILKLNRSRLDNPEKHSMIDEYWLLITIEGTYYANYSGVHDDQISIRIKNCYSSIFVYHERENWIVELNIL